jgi:hypothetical protein
METKEEATVFSHKFRIWSEITVNILSVEVSLKREGPKGKRIQMQLNIFCI